MRARIRLDSFANPLNGSWGMVKACHYPKLFSFALEAQRILAGGSTTGESVVIAFAPRMGRRTGTRRKEIL
jgi:hypothetical protein